MKFAATLFTLLTLATAAVAVPAGTTQERDVEQRDDGYLFKWWSCGYDDNYNCGDGCHKISFANARSKVTYQCHGGSWVLHRDYNNRGTLYKDGQKVGDCFTNNNDNSVVCY